MPNYCFADLLEPLDFPEKKTKIRRHQCRLQTGERSSHDGFVVLRRYWRIVGIPDDAILIAFPAEDGVIGETVAPRGRPQLVTLVEDEASHESEEQLETVGRCEEAYYRVQDHPGRDDHGGDGGHLRGGERF
jgi:hypothetical protein